EQARHGDQAYLPAQQPQAQARPRFPCAHEDRRWPQDPGAPPRQGSSSPDRLTRGSASGPAPDGMTLPTMSTTPVSAQDAGVVVSGPGHPCGYPRAARVRAKAEFARVFEQGRRVAEPMLALHWLADDAPARLGMAVSRKVDPRAVGRNRIK